MANQVQHFEQVCRGLYQPKAPQEHNEAKAILDDMESSEDVLGICFEVLSASTDNNALFHSFKTIQAVCIR